MEITRRFIKFLEELEDPQVQEKHLNLELEENLRTITSMISKLNLNDNKKANSINDIQLFENTLKDGCLNITKRLKETIEAVCLLHVYLTNFPLNPFNIHRYLTAYCQAVFECSSISFISPHVQAIKFMKIVNGQNILDMDAITKIVKELDSVMADKVMYALEGSPPGALETFITGKNYIGNIVVKLEKGQDRFYLIMHFTKDSPFTGSFITGKYYEAFPSIFSMLTDILGSVIKNIYPSKMDPFLDKLETIKLELIELYKRYYLSYIATEISSHLDCEVSTSVVIDQKEEEIESKLAKAEKRSIQMVLSNKSILELKNNFQWDNKKLNQRLSSLWAKLKSSARVREQRTFYHFAMQNTDHLFLEFNKKGYLIFQSKPIQQTNLKNIVEVADFLMESKARFLDEVLAQSPRVLEIVRALLKETEESKNQTVAKQEETPDVTFEFIGKRKEGKNTLEGFAIVLKDERPPLKKRNSDPLDSLIDNLDNCSENYPTLDPTIKKVKRLLSARHVNPRKLLGEHADLSALKKTIISEYLPEEFSNGDEKAHKSISSVNKIKLDVTSKTAFMDSPLHKKSGSTKVTTSMFAGPKISTFSVETLVSRSGDRATLEDWSFDAINIEDPVEKNRLVWAMLDSFDLIKEFNIDLTILCEFITRMKERYCVSTNSFHNYEHGITVMHGSFYILRHISTKFTNLVNLGILISAFCHDASHTGRTNIFEVNSGSRLALKYHDKSVLEQHHAAVTFKVLSKATSNIFSTVKNEDYKQLRKLIISNILATDMKNHFEVMNSFGDLRSRMDKSGEENFTWGDDDVTSVANMVVHCSDLCGPTKSFPVAFHWAQRINEEFSIQVREEETLGIPVTPYFRDLDKPHIMAKQEVAFISFMIKPLWESCNKFFGGAMQIAVDNIEANVKQWNVLLEDALKKKEAEEAGQKESK